MQHMSKGYYKELKVFKIKWTSTIGYAFQYSISKTV